MNLIEDTEVELKERQYLTSKTDAKGKIISVNSYFCEISGYSKQELLGQNHNIIRHHDMPKVIFNLMWEFLKNDKDFFGVIKNKTKSGKYYWVLANIEVAKEENKKTGYYSFRSKIVNKDIVEEIEELYSALNEIEQSAGVETSITYLRNFLSRKKMTYDTYIKYLIKKNNNKKGFFESLFS